MSKQKIAFIAAFASIALYFLGACHAHAAVVIAQQLEDSLTGSTQTTCDNRCSDITVGSQVFTVTTSGNLGSLEVFTSNFGTNSRYPETNSCYLTIYDQDSEALIATSDNQFTGYGCAGDLSFIFKNSQPFLEAGKQYRWNYVFGGQNFSSITFIGGPDDTVGGSFNVAPLGGAKFKAFAEIMPPESIGQFSDLFGKSPIPHGGTIVDFPRVTMFANTPLSLPGSFQLQVELKPSFVPFTGEPNFTSTFVPSGSVTGLMATQLVNNAYHWIARFADADGNTSAWKTMDDATDTPDFYVHNVHVDATLQDNVTSYHRNAQPNPCFGDGTIFSCALSPSFMDYWTNTPFTISKVTFDWNNSGANNCDNAGNYGAVITNGNTAESTIIATSTNTVYLGCANSASHGNVKLDFASETIPANFHFTLSAFDGMLQGGSDLWASNITIYGTPASSTIATSTKKNPVVIVPGILGSTLDKASDGEEVWPNADALIVSGSDSYLNELKLEPTGEQVAGMEMDPSDIVRTVTTSIPLAKMNFYKPLIDSLTAAGYREGIDLFVAPYDWRLDMASSAARLATVVQNAIAHSPDGKIDMVAHSMGGLVAKEYLSRLSAASSTFMNKLILVGVPQLGAPQMFKALQYGDDLGFHIGPLSLLAPSEVKALTQNMPSAYALLPSRRFIETQGGYVIDNRNGGNTTLDFDHTNDFLISNTNDGRNAMLLAGADTFHATQDYDSANASSVYNIVGCQNPATVSSFVINDAGDADIVHGPGDGTVPIGSAMNLANGYQTYFSLYSENGADHVGLISGAKPLALITAILGNTTSSLALAPLGISTSTQDCLSGRSQTHNETTIEVSTHSPVSLSAYDSQNRHTGLATNNTIDFQIPGSSYETIGENSFLLLPASDTYRIIGSAQATGTFTMKIKSLDAAANILSTVTYVKVPLASTSTTATLTVASSTPAPTLTLDAYGDGTSVAMIDPTASLSMSSSTDTTPPAITASTIPETVSYGTPITFDFSAIDDLSGIATTSALLDGAALASGTMISDLSEGSHILEIESIDNAGNPRIASSTFRITKSISDNNTTGNGGGSANSQVISVPAGASGNSGIIKRQCKKKIKS